jgi:dTDP-4-dehydrorhamnose 3,5-epimerase
VNIMDVKRIEGGLHVDHRGVVSFVNDFDFQGVDRFYTVRAHKVDDPRGWVGHRTEDKWFTPLEGTMLIAVVAPDDWKYPTSNIPVQRFILSSLKPVVLHVPAGHATASVMLTTDALLGVFSSGKIADAGKDDWRFDLGAWDVRG